MEMENLTLKCSNCGELLDFTISENLVCVHQEQTENYNQGFEDGYNEGIDAE